MEGAHYTMQRKLTAEIHKEKLKTSLWSKWLPRIVCRLHINQLISVGLLCSSINVNHLPIMIIFIFPLSIIDAMNTQAHEATGISPYELAFSVIDAMDTQAHEATGTSPYELVFL